MTSHDVRPLHPPVQAPPSTSRIARAAGTLLLITVTLCLCVLMIALTIKAVR